MEILALNNSSIKDLIPFLEKCAFIPFSEYDIDQESIVNNAIEELSELDSRGGSILIVKEQDKTVGLLSFERSDWDSDHFGFDISKITHLLSLGSYHEALNIKEKLISDMLQRSLGALSLHVSTRVNKENLSSIHALEGKSFRLMDVLVTCCFDLRKRQIKNIENQISIRPFRQDELPRLKELAWACFGYKRVATDRFHADPTLPKEKSDELYVEWLNTLISDPSSEVFVAESDGNPVGFNVCTLNKPLNERLGVRFGTVVLTAVKPSERRKNAATSLLSHSLNWFNGKVDIVETGGQVSNYAILRAWWKLGFKIIKSQCTFHWSVLPDSL
jgi:ribosomal protein S18 acetylase RimI-like enzyme